MLENERDTNDLLNLTLMSQYQDLIYVDPEEINVNAFRSSYVTHLLNHLLLNRSEYFANKSKKYKDIE